MDCPECSTGMIAFSVPPDLRDASPGGEAAAAICPRCLTLEAASAGAADPDFARIIQAFPNAEEGGVAMALAVGLLVESLALNRDTVASLLERVIAANSDPWLVFERLAVSSTIQTDADIERASRQLEQLLG